MFYIIYMYIFLLFILFTMLSMFLPTCFDVETEPLGWKHQVDVESLPLDPPKSVLKNVGNLKP